MKTYYINPSYEEIISAIKEKLKGSPIDENIKYVRFLKLLYIALRSYVPREYLKRAFGGLKVLTDDGKLVDSDQCFLHDAYGSEEKWVAWRDRGFKIDPLVSLKYMTDESEVSSWREFFRDVGIMENAKNEIIGNFAVWFVEKRLAEMGYTVTPGGTGYDLHVLKEGGEAFVEVKGTRLNEAETINLTEVESQAAHKYGEKHWLIVVEGIPNHPRVWRLRNPVRSGFLIQSWRIARFKAGWHAVGKVFKWPCPARCVVAAGRFELVRRLLAEAEEYLARGDAVQSSEKFYKVAEECVKALSERLGLPEAKEAEVKGRWTVALLERAVRRLADELGVDVQLGWDAAGHLHVWGFHEAKLEVEDVKARIPLIKRLVELAEKTCTE